MYKKVLMASLTTASILFSGCGNSDTTCRIDVQKALDKGNYDTAISDLNGRCKDAFTASDLNMNLAAAMMGKSGYSVSDIADMLINSDSQGSAFSSFLKSVEDKKTPDSLPRLLDANSYFTKAIERNGFTNPAIICRAANLRNLNDSRVTNACLYIGFNKTIQAANTVTYLTGNVDGLVNSIDNNANNTPYDMRASLDALAWAMKASYTPNPDTTITSTDITIAGHPFAHLVIDYSDNAATHSFYRLARSSTRDANNTTVITDGYCDENGNRENCQNMEDNTTREVTNPIPGCYACPVVLDTNGSTLSVANLLVDTLNGGSDAVTAVSDDPDITNSIGDFKEEITGSRDGNVTIDDIINYLQK